MYAIKTTQMSPTDRKPEGIKATLYSNEDTAIKHIVDVDKSIRSEVQHRNVAIELFRNAMPEHSNNHVLIYSAWYTEKEMFHIITW